MNNKYNRYKPQLYTDLQRVVVVLTFGGEDQGYDKPVKTQNFCKDENQDHANKEPVKQNILDVHRCTPLPNQIANRNG